MSAGLQVYDTDGSKVFDSSVEGVKFLHTLMDGQRLQDTSDIRYGVVGTGHYTHLLVEVPVKAPPEIVSKLTTDNTLVFLRMWYLDPASTHTGIVYVGEYRNGYLRVILQDRIESSFRSDLRGNTVGYYITLVWMG